jgi:polysaccharide biosynthesis/export protein
MTGKQRGHWVTAIASVLAVCLSSTGCVWLPQWESCKPMTCDTCPMAKCTKADVVLPMARELNKVSLPPYVIEPPDVLAIDALRVIPLSPYRIEPLDGVIVQVNAAATKPGAPIAGVYFVEPSGTINLGASYGSVRVAGLTVDEATTAVESHTKKVLKAPQVSVALAQSRAMQQVRGAHQVRQDGTVGLGVYGSVYVAGMTLADAKSAIEEHLAGYVVKPEISVDVAAYNSKVCYVITDSAAGKHITRVPILGNETVLDALSHVPGALAVSSRNGVWIARPAPAEIGGKHILPVDLVAITEDGSTATNYQVMPGDRIFVRADR